MFVFPVMTLSTTLRPWYFYLGTLFIFCKVVLISPGSRLVVLFSPGSRLKLSFIVLNIWIFSPSRLKQLSFSLNSFYRHYCQLPRRELLHQGNNFRYVAATIVNRVIKISFHSVRLIHLLSVGYFTNQLLQCKWSSWMTPYFKF